VSGHEGVLDMLVAVAQVMRQHSTEQLAKELNAVRVHPPADDMVSTVLQRYLRQAEAEAALATVARHFEQVPRAWIDAAVATTLDLAKEPYKLAEAPPLPRAADTMYIPPSGPRWEPADVNRVKQLRGRQAAILAAIEKNNATLLPADLQSKSKS